MLQLGSLILLLPDLQLLQNYGALISYVLV